ncbi:MAG: MBL fold metallo-hydrolase [Aestuariivirgaceae bacterium]
MPKDVNPYYQGPVTDHFDGVRFFTPGHQVVNCTSDLLKWQFSGEKSRWPKRVENQTHQPPPERVNSDGLSATYIGHATVLLQLGGLNILTDPFLSSRTSPVQWFGPKRVRDPGIAADDLPRIDIILVSHNHYDHMDLPALTRLYDLHGARIITPLGNGAIINKARRPFDITEGDWGDRFRLTEDIHVTLTPAKHWSKRTTSDRNMALWAAFVIETPHGPVYFAADSGYGGGDHFRDIRTRFGRPRLALIPIGAYEPRWFMQAQHMNPEEAVLAHNDLAAHRSLAIHHGTVQLTDEAIDQPVIDHEIALDKHGVDAGAFRATEPGESWTIPPLATSGSGVLEQAAE